ncbi:carbon-nitrogen hydrolase family protein [Castellaniella sp. S9]|uniref:carbon-nitrogen hydrolase family protein n=1 Tax=Castellaniella sp. S9 TaxID=2993652 RepID=UPI0022B5347D|nr:carbon-nitrogen hydrolase family protein [Castellaniella sp. S9]
MNTMKAAVIQAGSVAFNLEATLQKLEQLVAEAARGGAKLAVLPEAFVSAYPKWLDFGCRVGQRRPEGREDFRRYWASSIEVPGQETARIGALAREHDLYLVLGVIERDGMTLYCTVLFFSPEGKLLGKHRKLMPTASERLVWGFGDGSTLAAFDTPFGKLGAVICWENYMPLLRMSMYSKGVTLYCTPTADDRDTWLPTVQHIALEGRCFVLSSCQVMRRKDFPEDYDIGAELEPDAVMMRGGSCIIGPLGQVLAGPVFDEQTILYADLDLDEVARSRLDFDAIGHYSRPDIFKLIVDERPQNVVSFTNEKQALHEENDIVA